MKRLTRSKVIVIVVTAAFLLALVVAVVVWANGLQHAAEAGKAQAKAGLTSLASRDATAAASQFAAAKGSFTRARALLGPEWVGSVANVIPAVGRQFEVARALVAIGLDGSTAGAELSIALAETPSESSTVGANRLGALLAAGRLHIDTALAALRDVADRSLDLSEDGLVPPLARAVLSVKQTLVGVRPFLDRSRALLTLERYLLSSERRILVISQNSAELRPTGGFIGTYGVLRVGPKGISLEKYKDVYTLPDPPGRVTPPPGAIMTNDFGFRDANWWIDYPTSARAMLGFWQEYGQPPVDGIIAIDVVAVKDLLEVFGPVRVASYDETFTADNMLDRLLYLVEVRSGGLSTKKDVLVALANEVEQRVLSSGVADLARSGLALAKAADAKHVQVYFSDTGAQSAITDMGWSGAIAPPAGATDVLAVSNAMTQPGKINIAMRKTMDYEVALDADGSAETTLVLGYSNTAPYTLPPVMSTSFRDYLRVYRTIGTAVARGAGRSSDGGTNTVEAGLSTIVRTFTLRRGETRRETIITRVPDAWRLGAAPALPRSPALPASSSASGRVAHYRLFIVRQADLQDVPTTVIVTPPAGWRVSGAGAWETASGERLPVTSNDSLARLAVSLNGDVVIDVELESR